MPPERPLPDPDPVEELVFQCLEADDRELALEKLRRDHPELEGKVTKILARLESEGLLNEPDEEPKIPDRLGPFRLIRELGAGGMGIVYLAEQEDLARHIALKLIRPEHLYFPGSRERFRREVEAVARLQHPGIVPVFTAGEENGLPFFTMEYVEGRSLAEVLRELREKEPARLSGHDLAAVLDAGDERDKASRESSTRREVFSRPWTYVCTSLVTQIAEALEHAHARGVLHRDVKPSNILITHDGRARLLDFGLARTEGAQQLTQSSTQIGSLPYLPPEQLDEQTRIPSERQDVYSLGVTMYEMLALTNPFLGETAAETRRRIRDGRPPSLRERNPAVSWDLETVCLMAMDPDPTQRYASTTALLRDLDHVRHRRPIEARRPSAWIRLRRWEQRHPAATAALGVGLILVAAATLLLALFETSARRQADRLTQRAQAAQAEAEQRATEAGQVTGFLVDLFQYASPDKSLGEELPVSLLLNQGATRIEKELTGQPAVRARMLATFGRVYGWLEEPVKATDFYRRAISARGQVVADASDYELLDLQHDLAVQLTNLGQYAEATSLLDDVKRRAEATLEGAERPGLLSLVVRAQATIVNLHGDGTTAERMFGEALALERQNPRATPVSLVECIRAVAVFLNSAHRYAKAQELLDECLAQKVYPEGHPALIMTMNLAAQNLALLGRYDEAKTYADKALAEVRRVFGPDHPMVARVLRGSAVVAREAGRPKEAIAHLERACTIAEKYRVFSKQYFARMLNLLAISHHMMGSYTEARDLLERALRDSREAFEGDHVLTAFLTLQLGETLAGLNEMEAAERWAADGLAMIQRMDPTGPYRARAKVTVAWIAIQMSELDRARAAVNDAISIAQRFQSEKWTLGRAYVMRALLSNLANDGPSAQRAAEKSAALFDEVRAGDHPAKAMTLYHRAWAQLLQRNRPRAEEFFKQSIAMYRRLGGGGEHTDIAWPLNHYGFALMGDRPDEAIPLLEEALAIRRKTLGPRARWRIITTLNLGMAYAGAKRFTDAEPLLLEVHARVLETSGAESAAGRASFQRMAKFYRSMGKPEEAAKFAVPRAGAGK